MRSCALVLAIAAALVACGGDDAGPTPSDPSVLGADTDDENGSRTPDEESGPSGTVGSTGEDATVDAAGGTDPGTGDVGGDALGGSASEATFIAAQWPDCLNPIQSCSSSQWLWWTVLTHVAARAMEFDAAGDLVASPLLTMAPTADNGGLISDDETFVLTYRLDPDAVWSDGVPITCDDFEFTRRAHLDTPGVRNAADYGLIRDIDCADPRRAVISFERPFARWADLFGGTGLLLPAHGFESTDVSSSWLSEVPISGGPWSLEAWGPGRAVLVPNQLYWDESRAPLIDRVVFVPRESTETEIASLEAGEGLVALPRAFPGAATRLSAGDLDFAAGGSNEIEGLWPNQLGPSSGTLLGDLAVRRALLYALDRPAIADAALGSSIGTPVPVLNCAGWLPTIGDWCDETDFGDVEQDFDMVTEILEADGWTFPDGQECWQKDGRELRIEWNTDAGNARRERVQALVRDMTRPIGICWTVRNYEADELFENRLPVLDVNLGLYARRWDPDPSVTRLYGTVPVEENGFSGENYTGCRDEPCLLMEQLALEADRTVDPAARLEIMRQIGDIARDQVVWIPLYQLPNLTAWRTDLIEGPIGEFTSSIYGGFANMYDWTPVG